MKPGWVHPFTVRNISEESIYRWQSTQERVCIILALKSWCSSIQACTIFHYPTTCKCNNLSHFCSTPGLNSTSLMMYCAIVDVPFRWVFYLCMPFLCTGMWEHMRMLHRQISEYPPKFFSKTVSLPSRKRRNWRSWGRRSSRWRWRRTWTKRRWTPSRPTRPASTSSGRTSTTTTTGWRNSCSTGCVACRIQPQHHLVSKTSICSYS